MMLAAYLAYLAGIMVLVMSPGPDFIFALSRGLAHGWRGGITAAGGIALGLVTHTALALLGLGAVLAASPRAFEAVKVLGAVYLAYLALRMLTGRDLQVPAEDAPADPANAPCGPAPYARILRQGYLVNVLNPGAALTFAAYLPQFVPADAPNKTALFLLLAATAIVWAFTWFTIAGTFAGTFTHYTRTRPAALKIVRLTFGIVLLILAALLLLAKR